MAQVRSILIFFESSKPEGPKANPRQLVYLYLLLSTDLFILIVFMGSKFGEKIRNRRLKSIYGLTPLTHAEMDRTCDVKLKHSAAFGVADGARTALCRSQQ